MGRKPRVGRTPRREVGDCAERFEEWERFGDVRALIDRSESLPPLEG
jgi:hypothetical protein